MWSKGRTSETFDSFVCRPLFPPVLQGTVCTAAGNRIISRLSDPLTPSSTDATEEAGNVARYYVSCTPYVYKARGPPFETPK